jgi:glycosyltransferase involved in cell wall biosynthesis
MKIAFYAGHIGSQGLVPSRQHGGGEMHTFGLLSILNQFYDVTAIVPNGVYPAFESAAEYGIDLQNLDWKPIGDSFEWVRAYDVLISMNHAQMAPPVCRRNILSVFFPQYPEWDVSGYDTIITNSQYTATWVKRYWGRDATAIYPPVPVRDITAKTAGLEKQKSIVSVGRFFDVPGGNNKQHLTLLKAFQDLMRPDWTLTFVGAVQNAAYYQRVRDAAAGDSRIYFHHNLTREQYLELLGKSVFIWAATGYEAKKPSSKEHFGIFPVEGMAAGCIPIVHNSGGTPETGCLTWDSPQELIDITKELQSDPEKLVALINEMPQRALRFDIEERVKDVIEVIERPIVLNNHDWQSKIFLPELKPEDIKVGIMSDSPMTTTGFGTVSHAVVRGLMKRGFRVVSFGIQDPQTTYPRLNPPDMEALLDKVLGKFDLRKTSRQTLQQALVEELHKIEPCTVWRGCRHDSGNWDALEDFIRIERPDVLYLNYDPGNVRLMIDHLRDIKCSAPIVAYMPIEGKPVIAQYIELLRLIKVLNGKPILYTRYGVEAVKEAGGPACQYLYHGADHAAFQVLPEEQRRQLRLALGWENKRVLMFVGRNKRTKGFGTLLQTAKLLKESGHREFVWYLHTSPYDMMQNSSMPLDQMALDMGIEDVIVFPPDFNQLKGIPYDSPAFTGQAKVTEGDVGGARRAILSSLSLIERYNLADIYVNMSELEGFGLPTLEAMGCGLPVISVDDQGVQKEVLGNAPVYVPVSHWDPSWHTGAKLAQANPMNVAEAILKVSKDDKLRMSMSIESREQWAKYKWDDTVNGLMKAILEQIE